MVLRVSAVKGVAKIGILYQRMRYEGNYRPEGGVAHLYDMWVEPREQDPR